MGLWCLVGVLGNCHVRHSSVRETTILLGICDLHRSALTRTPQAVFYFWSFPELVRKSLALGLYLVTVNARNLTFDVWKLKRGTFSGFVFCFRFFVISVVTPKSHHFISREQAPALHLFLLFICVPKLFPCCYSYLSFVILARKFVVLSCHFRRQKNSKESCVASKVMLAVVFDGVTSTTEHLSASGIWIILTFLLSSPIIFIFCWSIREADGPKPYPPKVCFSCNLWNRNVFFVFFLTPTLSIALILERKKVATCSGDSALIPFFAKYLLKVSKIQTIICGIVNVSLKFNFKSVKIHCFVIHNPVENLVALICLGSRKSLLILWWLVKSDAL